MGRDKISTTLLNTLMCGGIGRISRVGSFVELEVLSTKMMSSFDSCQVLLSPNFTYELSLEIQKYRLQCGRIYEISVRIYEIMGKLWVDIAYGVQGAAAFLGICVLKLWEAALSCCGCVLIIDAYSFVPPPAAVIDISIHLLRPPEAKNRCFSSC